MPVVLELLKIKAVYDNAGARNNEALRLAAQNKHWLVSIELLKVEPIRRNLAVNNHEVLRMVLNGNELGISYLLIKIYREQDVYIPDDLTAAFETRSKSLSASNKCIDSMIALCEGGIF